MSPSDVMARITRERIPTARAENAFQNVRLGLDFRRRGLTSDHADTPTRRYADTFPLCGGSQVSTAEKKYRTRWKKMGAENERESRRSRAPP